MAGATERAAGAGGRAFIPSSTTSRIPNAAHKAPTPNCRELFGEGVWRCIMRTVFDTLCTPFQTEEPQTGTTAEFSVLRDLFLPRMCWISTPRGTLATARFRKNRRV